MDRKELKQYVKDAVSFRLGFQNVLGIGQNKSYEKHFELFPKSLFKYRNFDNYTLDSLNNSYIYLSPADQLDDQFECSPNFNSEINYDDVLVKKYLIDEIANLIDDYPSCFQKSDFKKYLLHVLKGENYISTKDAKIFLKKHNADFSNLTEDDKKYFIEIYGNLLVGMWMTDKNKICFNDIVKKALGSKYNIGIGSLSKINTSQVMWSMYSNNYSGYCVEYDTTDDINLRINTFPVVYGNKRQTNVLSILIGMAVESMLVNQSKENIELNRSLDYINLYINKHKEWEFQKEWRIVGHSKRKFKMKKIKAIYLGKNCAKDKEKLILDFASKKQIEVYKQEDNLVDLSLTFRKIL